MTLFFKKKNKYVYLTRHYKHYGLRVWLYFEQK